MECSQEPSLYVEVLVDNRVDKPLCYKNPGLDLTIGSRIVVPLKNRKVKATVVRCLETPSFANVLQVERLLEEESLSKDLNALCDWMSSYYLTPRKKVLSTILPATLKKNIKKQEQYYIEKNCSLDVLQNYCAGITEKNNPQKKVLEVLLLNSKGMFLTELIEKAQVSRSPIDTLIKKGYLKEAKIEVDRTVFDDDEIMLTPHKKLNTEQKAAFDQLNKLIEERKFHTELLFGVTGSGKTEVYLQAIQACRQKGLGVIFLVPEIALTTQTIERVRSRFDEKIAVLHHRLSDGERYDAYRGIQSGRISIVIGARSAIFAPVKNLGLIIVDEEQDNSFKQSEEMPCYHARDVAIVRAKINNCLCVLGSATPAFETFYNTTNQKFGISVLKNRAMHNPLPKVHIVDMNFEDEKNKNRTLFSDLLLSKIREKLQNGEQVLLFLNRRGYYKCQVCTQCKQAVKCHQCDVCLTFHRNENTLSCHLCGFNIPYEKSVCITCNSSDLIRFRGPGTEQVERAIKAIFKDANVLRMDRDTTKHKGSHDDLYQKFRSHKADILIGTQMIAKGLDFPFVSLVGILDADSMLNIPDFRSAENAFQLLSQVAGRAGRAEYLGEVVLQTRLKDYPVVQLAAAQDFPLFFEQELAMRKNFSYPPFSKMVKIQLKSVELDLLERFGAHLVAKLRKIQDVNTTILDFSLCGMSKAKGMHRGQILIKATKYSSLVRLIPHINFHKQIKITIDVDPIHTFF